MIDKPTPGNKVLQMEAKFAALAAFASVGSQFGRDEQAGEGASPRAGRAWGVERVFALKPGLEACA